MMLLNWQEFMEDSELDALCPRAYAVVTHQPVPGDRTAADGTAPDSYMKLPPGG